MPPKLIALGVIVIVLWIKGEGDYVNFSAGWAIFVFVSLSGLWLT